MLPVRMKREGLTLLHDTGFGWSNDLRHTTDLNIQVPCSPMSAIEFWS